MDSPASLRTVSEFEMIKLEIRDRVATIRLARPTKLNPLDWATIGELSRAVDVIETQASITVAVITGSGRSFSAGGDLDGYLRLYQRPEDFAAFLKDFGSLLDKIERSRIIFLAAVNGICVAGGLEILLACDLVVAAEDARIGDAHLNFGQLPGAGGSQRLPRAVGALQAKYLVLTGGLVDAAEAKSMGLVNKIFPPDKFEEGISDIIDGLLSKSSAGLSGAKYLINLTNENSLQKGLQEEINFVHRYATTHPDAMEGLTSFRDKRKPKFLG
jgi:enoyl-CoA hydratase/carnithine racemase